MRSLRRGTFQTPSNKEAAEIVEQATNRRDYRISSTTAKKAGGEKEMNLHLQKMLRREQSSSQMSTEMNMMNPSLDVVDKVRIANETELSRQHASTASKKQTMAKGKSKTLRVD